MSDQVAATLKAASLQAFRAAVGVLGDGQAWTNTSPDRASGTTYANITTRPIKISVVVTGSGAVLSVRPSGGAWGEVSSADGTGRNALRPLQCETGRDVNPARLEGQG